MSSFHVTKLSPELVGPSEPTPSVILPLSSWDSPMLRFHMEVMQVFRRGRGPHSVTKEALSKALVSYYPVAGRIDITADHNHVDCTGNDVGVWFVEASADCTLEDVEFLESHPIMIPKEDLLPSPPPQVDEDQVIFMMQVTQFKNEGFVVGIKFNHVVFDGIGAAQFTRTVGEIAAGRQPTFKPIWSRDALPDPTPTRSGGTPPSPPIFEPIPPAVEYVTDFSHDQIGRVRDRFFNETGTNCSTFDVVTAKLWQSRVRAIGPEPAVAVTLCSPVDMRRLLIEDMLKLEGDYYGSCGYSLVVSERSDRIAGAASLVEVVGLVKEAKERMPGRLSTWLEGDPQENPFNVASVDYGLTHMVDWRWIGFGEVDFGSGTPDSVAPLNGFEGCNFLLRSPLPKKGVRLMTNSIAREHVEAFRNEMKDLF